MARHEKGNDVSITLVNEEKTGLKWVGVVVVLWPYIKRGTCPDEQETNFTSCCGETAGQWVYGIAEDSIPWRMFLGKRQLGGEGEGVGGRVAEPGLAPGTCGL